MVGTSISDEVDGIRAPTMWMTRMIHHRMAANLSFFERITLRAAVRCKLIACDTDPRHTFWVGRTSYGESRFNEIRESPVPEDDDEKSGYARDILPGLIDDYLDFKSQVLSCGEAEF
jgi:hypothetical protein